MSHQPSPTDIRITPGMASVTLVAALLTMLALAVAACAAEPEGPEIETDLENAPLEAYCTSSSGAVSVTTPALNEGMCSSLAGGVIDDQPECLHYAAGTGGDISSIETTTATTASNRVFWAITDGDSDDRRVNGRSYQNSKWLFAMQDGRVVGRHLIVDDIAGAHAHHDPEAVVRSGSLLATVDAGLQHRAGMCFRVTSEVGSKCRVSPYTPGSTCELRTTQEACTADALCGWIEDVPSVAGRTKDSGTFRPYSVFRFAEPATVNTGASFNVLSMASGAVTHITFAFPTTGCGPGTDRPCGQLGDLAAVGSSLRGYYNIEAATVAPGDRLVLFSKAPNSMVVNSSLRCGGGFWSYWPAGSNDNPVRIDNGDVHIFQIPSFSTMSGSVTAQFVARVNMHQAPYYMPTSPVTAAKISDAATSGSWLAWQSATTVFRVPVGPLTVLNQSLFLSACPLEGPSVGTCPTCLWQNEAFTMIGNTTFHAGEQAPLPNPPSNAVRVFSH